MVKQSLATDVSEELRDELSDQVEHLVHALEIGNVADFRESLEELHEYDQAQFYLNLPPHLRQRVISWLAPNELAEIFDEMDPDSIDISELLNEMTHHYAAQMLEQMYSDNSVDFLEKLDPTELNRYMTLMPQADAQAMRELLDYAPDTAGAMMGNEFISISEYLTIKEAMLAVKQAAAEAVQITYIYVVDDQNRLVGVISMRTLILENDDTLVKDVMDTNLITVDPNDDQEDVAHVMADYNFTSLPVTAEDEMVGIITVDDVMDVMDEEATEDYSKLAGVDVDGNDGSAMRAAFKRLPWLIGLIFLGMGTASVIDGFNALVQTAPILAVFISLITGTAGNAGTQSLAVSVRRLALGESQNLLRMLLTEVLIGAVIGAVAGFTIFAVVSLWKGNALLGLAVGLAMGVAILVANIAGAFIPMVMEKIGVDPAVASGPFISTLSDLTSVVIYFNIAGLFIRVFGIS